MQEAYWVHKILEFDVNRKVKDDGHTTLRVVWHGLNVNANSLKITQLWTVYVPWNQ